MNEAPASVAADLAQCLALYDRLRADCRTSGLRRDAVERSRRDLSEFAEGSCVLKAEAYRPTGVALGCPLPPAVQARLMQVGQAAESLWMDACAGDRPVMAFVPPGWFHVTLVNRTHYSEDATITSLTDEEFATVAQCGLAGRVRLRLQGLILTREGALLVPGFPQGDDLFSLRRQLVGAVPALGGHVPVMAHVKIGHVLTDVPNDQLAEVVEQLDLLGSGLVEELVFEDVYTPRGRIPLGVAS